MRILNDEEAKKAIGEENDRRCPLRGPMADLDCYNAVAKAQRKLTLEQVLGWGDELDWAHNMDVRKRKDCPTCWQELKQLAEDAVKV